MFDVNTSPIVKWVHAFAMHAQIKNDFFFFHFIAWNEPQQQIIWRTRNEEKKQTDGQRKWKPIIICECGVFCVLQLNDTHYECKQIYIYIKNNIFIVKRKKALFAPINRMVSFDFLSLGVFV